MTPEIPGATHGSRPRRKTVFRLLALGLSFTLACGVAEVGLRIAGYGRSYVSPFRSFHVRDPVLGWRGKPSFTGRMVQRDFDVQVTHDEHGFRQPAHATTPSEGQRNVYVLGDSFIWGWGVGQGQVVTDHLQSRLPGVRVHNLGLCASGTAQQYVLFQERLYPQLRPGDTVLVGFFVNDYGDNVGRNEPGCLYATLQKGDVHLVPPDGTACDLFNLLTYAWDRGKLVFDAWKGEARSSAPPSSQSDLPAEDFTAYAESPEVQITKYYLGEFRKACAERQAEFLVAYIPSPGELGEDAAHPDYQPRPEQLSRERQALLRYTEGEGIPTLDLLPPFLRAKERGQCQRVTFPHDMHWNAAGHAVAAEIIAAFLTARDEARLAAVKKDTR
jgi:lysophospholipase L1-like esterase